MSDRQLRQLTADIPALRKGPGDLESLVRLVRGSVLEVEVGGECGEMILVYCQEEQFFAFVQDVEEKAVLVLRA